MNSGIMIFIFFGLAFGAMVLVLLASYFSHFIRRSYEDLLFEEYLQRRGYQLSTLASMMVFTILFLMLMMFIFIFSP